MANNPSFDAFLRSHRERYDEFIRKLAEFIQAVTRNDHEAKIKAASDLAYSLNHLKSILSNVDQPEWIGKLEAPLRSLITNKNQMYADQAVNVLLSLYNNIMSHKWEFKEEVPEEPVDFDAIYRRTFTRSEMPAIFDGLIGALEEMVTSGFIDSIRAITALKKLIATIRRNAKGSYFSSAQTWFYAKTACRHLIFNLGEEIPGVSAIVKTIRHLIENGDAEWRKVQDEMKSEIKKATEYELPVLMAPSAIQRSLPAPDAIVEIENRVTPE
ncbi:MAG: hypothetical protein ABS79_03435 [Planctomycetes bacterium SCN 63-9]|nr:MAG: hypothetical protein ABS79_03435 [Planctomycetes bacterium SCN 63-9]